MKTHARGAMLLEICQTRIRELEQKACISITWNTLLKSWMHVECRKQLKYNDNRQNSDPFHRVIIFSAHVKTCWIADFHVEVAENHEAWNSNDSPENLIYISIMRYHSISVSNSYYHHQFSVTSLNCSSGTCNFIPNRKQFATYLNKKTTSAN